METYYQKNKEKLLSRQKAYYYANQEKLKSYAIEYYHANQEKYLVYQKKRRKEKSAELSEYQRKHYQLVGRKRNDNYREKILEWCQEHPDRVEMSRAVCRAVNNGVIIRPSYCSRCLRDARVHAHHINYEHYMNFIWLCASCHKKEHNGQKTS